jgi:transcription initiation factor TFIID TATA-box-binding protein
MKGRVTVFLSGKMISTGGRSIKESEVQLERAQQLLVANNFVTRIKLKPLVRNIVATANLNFSIDINGIVTCIPNIIYEPDQFPGAILRMGDGPVCLLFASGKIVIVGSKSEEQLSMALNKLEKLVKDYSL